MEHDSSNHLESYAHDGDLPRIFRERLDNVLNFEITPENIRSITGTVLNELVEITDDILTEYQKKHPEQDAVSKIEREHAAYEEYGLPNIGEILDEVQGKLNQIGETMKFI